MEAVKWQKCQANSELLIRRAFVPKSFSFIAVLSAKGFLHCLPGSQSVWRVTTMYRKTGKNMEESWFENSHRHLSALQVCSPELLQLGRWEEPSSWFPVWWGWGEQAPVGEIPALKSYQMKSFRISLNADSFFCSTLWTLQGKDVMTTISLFISIIWFLCHCWFIYYFSVSDIHPKLLGHSRRNINLCSEKAGVFPVVASMSCSGFVNCHRSWNSADTFVLLQQRWKNQQLLKTLGWAQLLWLWKLLTGEEGDKEEKGAQWQRLPLCTVTRYLWPKWQRCHLVFCVLITVVPLAAGPREISQRQQFILHFIGCYRLP